MIFSINKYLQLNSLSQKFASNERNIGYILLKRTKSGVNEIEYQGKHINYERYLIE